MSVATLHVIDSHTEGEPTRVVVAGGPDLGVGTLAQRAVILQRDHDWLRRAVCQEPRGHEAMVGALLCEPHEPDCVCGVIFFNNVSTLNMCIHGTIGLVATLKHLGRIGVGEHRIDTPVGVVTAKVREDQSIEITSVRSYRFMSRIELDVAGYGMVRGDVAWGGNWFFLIDGYGPMVHRANLDALTAFARAVRVALVEHGITGEHGMEIDHIEVFGPAGDLSQADSRNFVLCPGAAYDRSPCGTGTSAKLACLHADGRLMPGQVWRQAGILDTVFHGTIDSLVDGGIIPRVAARAWVNGESTYLLDLSDPFCYGIPDLLSIPQPHYKL